MVNTDKGEFIFETNTNIHNFSHLFDSLCEGTKQVRTTNLNILTQYTNA